ncbi:MAG TPA: hypothetical protein VMQ17_14250 [Candidatus Sulfotelmatobacter sp.]|nr:hypothetical protein [Candidatus Sulfotelmatobacter sp.]
MGKMQIRLGSWILASGVLLAGVTSTWAQGESHAVVVKAARRALSSPLSQIAPLPPASSGRPFDPDDDALPLRTPRATKPVRDAALQSSPEQAISSALTPLSTNSAGLNILGLGNGFTGFTDQANVPDANVAVGTTQFVQWVNESFAVFNKSDGSLASGPFNGNTLWQNLGGPCAANDNLDPIVQFDKVANRWVMMMPVFLEPQYLCIAVSKTADATGQWYQYGFEEATNSLCGGCRPFMDYPKLGVWPDGYYITYVQGDSSNNFIGTGACVADRNSMLTGAPATIQCFTQIGTAYGALLPADVDGTTPPATGSPEYFLSFDYNDRSLDLWQFHVDWTTPANSTFTGPTNIQVAAFTEACGETVVELNYASTFACIPQAGTPQMLDSYGDRLMYRLAYRNFGAHESLLANHTVNTGNGTQTGIRWYELQNTGSGFGVYQQGTYAPDSSYRWMGSIAMDRAGDIALGYSVSDSTIGPTSRYTGHVPGDPLGQMESENDVLSAASVTAGSQTLTYRWGDYSSMAIDPTDDCTFWYTSEYVPTTGSQWSTRISSFSLPSCTSPTLTVTVAGTGTVTSTPAGINCPTQCSSSFPSKTSVTLSAAAASGSSFGGWTGPCSGTAACTFAITSGLTVGATFNVPPDFTVTPSPSSAKVSAGGTAGFNLAIGAQGGFTSAVTLSCTAPTTQGVNCSLASTSATPGSSVSLTVTTAGPSAALTSSPRTMRSHPIYAAWIGFPALALVGIGSAGLRSWKRRLACLLFCAALLGSVALQMACGSSSSSGGPKNSGTPPGTYAVNINATSGSTQHSTSVSVTVQ